MLLPAIKEHLTTTLSVDHYQHPSSEQIWVLNDYIRIILDSFN